MTSLLRRVSPTGEGGISEKAEKVDSFEKKAAQWIFSLWSDLQTNEDYHFHYFQKKRITFPRGPGLSMLEAPKAVKITWVDNIRQ